MVQETDLSRLEKNVEKLLSRLDKTQSENVKLQRDIMQLEQEKQSLQGELASLQKETERLRKDKDTVHQRVLSLIGSIEEWEKSSAVHADDEKSKKETVPEKDMPSQGALGFTAGT